MWWVGVESEFSDRLWLELSLGQAEQLAYWLDICIYQGRPSHRILVESMLINLVNPLTLPLKLIFIALQSHIFFHTT